MQRKTYHILFFDRKLAFFEKVIIPEDFFWVTMMNLKMFGQIHRKIAETILGIIHKTFRLKVIKLCCSTATLIH